jgi:hypothetical protein
MTAYTAIVGLLAALCYGAYCGLVLEYGEKYRLVPEKYLIAFLAVAVVWGLVTDVLNLRMAVGRKAAD